MTHSSDRPIDTLRLSRRDRERILEAMNRPDRLRNLPDVERRRLRVRFDVGRVFLAIERSDGGCTKYSVTPRNLSSQGMAFIHGQYIHEDSRCEVVMPTLEGEWFRTLGTVTHCRHITGCVHEASVVFNEVIELDRFVPLTGVQLDRPAPTDEPTDAQQLFAGIALVIDRFESDRRLLRLWLNRIGLRAEECDDTAAALNLGLSRFDVILLDPLLHRDGWAMVERMRQADIDVPIIGLSADDTDAARAAALGVGCNAFLGKPWDHAVLGLIVQQLLLIEPTASNLPAEGPLHSTLADDPDMASIIRAFVRDLGVIGDDIEDAVANRDIAALRALCHQLKGSGTGYGFAPITDCARQAMIQFQCADPDLDVISDKIGELVAILRRARL